MKCAVINYCSCFINQLLAYEFICKFISKGAIGGMVLCGEGGGAVADKK
jgi:hypothetical protein